MKKLVPEVKSLGIRPGNSSIAVKLKSSALSKTTTKAPRWVNIDYPRPSEKVKKGHYAIRVHAPWATQAQVSTSGALWQNCRSDVGFFWFDWNPAKSGPQKINARARNGAGTWTKAEIRDCEVE